MQSPQSCPTLVTGCTVAPGPSAREILQARILEWHAMLSCRASHGPETEPASPVSPVSAGGFFTTGALGSPLSCLPFSSIFTLVFQKFYFNIYLIYIFQFHFTYVSWH